MFGQGLNFGGLTGGSAGFDADFLVVAGGGAGGKWGPGGGGGAGGLKTTTTYGGTESTLALSLSTAYTVTVGPGGIPASNGTDSSFSGSFTGSPITSTGGGRGAGDNSNNYPAAAGGSGAGGSGEGGGTGNGAGTLNQGKDGGTGYAVSGGRAGGGGGGAVAVGANATTNGGNGGLGLEANIIGGTGNFYAGGGGGATQTAAVGTGGSGGGGDGVANSVTTSINGTLNTGGGGGGGGSNSASGGSGVVILRYPTAKVSSYAVTGTLDTTEGASYPIANSAFYKLNNNVIDSSGNGYNGNASNVTYASGKFGKAAVFASNGNINTNIPASFFNTNTWSISLWIKPTGTAFKYFLGNGNTGINNGFAMGMYGDGSRFDFITRNSSTTVGRYQGGTPIPGVWTNVVIINNGNSYSFYQDNALMTNYGSFTQPASGGSYSSSNSFVLGRAGAMTAEQFAGKFDQVRIFSSVLSTANLTALYNEGTNEVLESTDGTDSILEFTGGSGDITFS